MALLVAVLRQRVFLAPDMVSNHAHIWYIADRLWHGHGIPLHMPPLAAGKAFAFPYGSMPWIVGALLWPLGGDRVVTFLFVAGAAATVAATFWTFPSLRRGWWAVAVLLNPALIASVLLGQLPFLWAAAAFMTAIGAWRRGRPAVATVLTAVATITHPAVLLPISAVAVLFALPAERRRWLLVGCWAIAAAAAVPALVLTIDSPVVTQTSHWTQLGNLVTTVLVRILVFAIPVALDVAHRHAPLPWRRPAFAAGLFVVLLAAMWRPFLLQAGWSAMARTRLPDDVSSFASSAAFDRGRIYRVLTGDDEKYGLYVVIRHGGVLDGELFPESMHRKGFVDDEAYAEFLRARRVASVVLTPSYSTHFSSNEPARLASLSDGRCTAGIRLTLAERTPQWQRFDVAPC